MQFSSTSDNVGIVEEIDFLLGTTGNLWVDTINAPQSAAIDFGEFEYWSRGGGNVGVVGTANTGGGGGGATNATSAGNAGGSGIVIVRYTHTYTQEPVIPIFADNNAASSLAVGAMYRTSAGVLNVRY